MCVSLVISEGGVDLLSDSLGGFPSDIYAFKRFGEKNQIAIAPT